MKKGQNTRKRQLSDALLKTQFELQLKRQSDMPMTSEADRKKMMIGRKYHA